MTELNPQYAAALQQLITRLCNAIDSGDTECILTAQKKLTATAEAIWSHLENEPIPSRDKALARLLAGGALEDLPKEIQDPVNYPRLQRELRLLKRSLELWT